MADVNDYQRQFYNLLPQGLAWPRDENTNLAAMLFGFAVELARVDTRDADLLRESYPAQTFELLTDWERVMGLPEDCEGAPDTLQARRDAIMEKLARRGGQSRQFFIDLAATLGFTITITEYRPFLCGLNTAGDACYDEEWRFAWLVNGPPVTYRYFLAGANGAGDALRTWGNELLECVLERLKPAHTVVRFGYGDTENIGLDTILDNVVFQLDAALMESFTGASQRVRNMIAEPSDGADQEDYNFYRGADNLPGADDPAFVGTPDTQGAYFAFDGGDFLKLIDVNPAFLNNLHKKPGGQDFTCILALRTPAADAAADVFFSTAVTGLSNGITVQQNASEVLELVQGDGTTATTCASGITLAAATDYLLIVSHSHAGNNTRFWANTTAAANVAHVFNNAAGTPANHATIAAATGLTGKVAAGTRLYGVAMLDEYIGDTDAAAIVNYYENLHGREYAP